MRYNVSVVIRRAKLEDYPVIESIVKRVKLYNYSYLYKFLIWWDRVFVVTIKNKVVAFISYVAIPCTQNVFCLQIGVDPEAQGKGLGVKLLDHLKRISVKLHQAKYVWGHTLKPRALAWFRKKMKWQVVGSAFGVSVMHSPEIGDEADDNK